LETPSKSANEQSLPEVVYAATPLLREPLVLLRNMVRDLIDSRHLAYRLLIRSLRSQYRQSLLGYLWVVIAPVAATGGLLFLSRQNVLRTVETSVPYGLYVFAGILLWQIFTDSYQRPIQWLSTYRSVMGRVNFPREALILGALCEVLIQAGIRVIMLFFVLLWFGREIGSTFLFAPLAIFALIGLGLVVGLLVAPIGLLYGDVERGMNLAMVFWFLMTPIVYPPPIGWPASLVNQVNPVSPLVVTARELLVGIPLSQLVPFLVVSTLVLAMLLAGWLLFRLALPHLVERVGG
jgi:homopolymeric O-antigen transport system permease protein